MPLYLNGKEFGPIMLNGHTYTAIYKDGVRYPLSDVELMYQVVDDSVPGPDWLPLTSGKPFICSTGYLLIMAKGKTISSMSPFDASYRNGGPWVMGPTSIGPAKYDYSYFADASMHVWGSPTYELNFTDGNTAKIAIALQGSTMTPTITF